MTVSVPTRARAGAGGVAAPAFLLRSRAPHDGHTSVPEGSGADAIVDWQRGHFMVGTL
jgi:hypothetical protein